MLISMPGCNELFTALFFATFTCMGIRVFMPMFPELKELKDWIEQTNSSAIIAPLSELNKLNDYVKEKNSLDKIKYLSESANIGFYDNIENFDLLKIIEIAKNAEENAFLPAPGWKVAPCSEAMIVSTSGTSGKTKLVVYDQKAYVINCMSWQQHGLFKAENFVTQDSRHCLPILLASGVLSMPSGPASLFVF
jgi:long-subunit acyl-CoA synthetase (AMP-forming)